MPDEQYPTIDGNQHVYLDNTDDTGVLNLFISDACIGVEGLGAIYQFCADSQRNGPETMFQFSFKLSTIAENLLEQIELDIGCGHSKERVIERFKNLRMDMEEALRLLSEKNVEAVVNGIFDELDKNRTASE